MRASRFGRFSFAFAATDGRGPQQHPSTAWHAIGRVLINRVIDEKGFAIFWDGSQPIEQWERGAVGFDFAEAGAMLLEH